MPGSRKKAEDGITLFLVDAKSKGIEITKLETLANKNKECEVIFELPISELAFYNRDMNYTAEPGQFRFWIGPDSTRGLTGDFEVVL